MLIEKSRWVDKSLEQGLNIDLSGFYYAFNLILFREVSLCGHKLIQTTLNCSFFVVYLSCAGKGDENYTNLPCDGRYFTF